ncbi:hypothetical protein QYM36_002735 [Artemia franciscana]|uniref:Uncharacterized protein n=1 Tax=Artemia franciscana TaxID=6661 RepID=A0AA88I1T2_ARTSF|nr:hypothetical protein QYM36_002735 [Artemia franciscana]
MAQQESQQPRMQRQPSQEVDQYRDWAHPEENQKPIYPQMPKDTPVDIPEDRPAVGKAKSWIDEKQAKIIDYNDMPHINVNEPPRQ